MPVKVDLHRLETTIRKYELYPVQKNKILLYGSSFFTNWGYERSQEQLSGIGGEEIATINHGFGGSTGDEQLYFYPRMVRPYEPKMIVIRGCVNDLGQGYSVGEAADMTMRLYGYAKADFPDVKFVVMTAFDFKSAPQRGNGTLPEKMAQYNRIMRHYAQKNPDMWVLDISPELYEDPANVGTYKGFKDVFVADGLHLTDEGYEMMAKFFKRELEKILAE